MRLDRRAFLRLGAAALGGLGLRDCTSAQARVSAGEIHRATRNTRLGAVGPRPALPGRPPPFKGYPGAERRWLPRPAQEAGRALEEVVRAQRSTPVVAAGGIDAASLRRLLRLANGVTGRAAARGSTRPLRAAPSAGALYAGEVYVVAERIDGLAPGVYYYSVPEDALVELAPGHALARVAEALESPAAISGAAAAVLLTNVFERYAWRYANRGYRYALIDSGHIGENLHLAAGAFGFGETSPPRFCDDLLNELLGVDGHREAVCALHGLGGATREADGAPGRRLVEQQEAAGAPPQGQSAPERYHEATKLVPSSGDVAPPAGLGTPALPEAWGAPLPLPRRAWDPGRGVAHCIEARRSAAHFRPDPLALEDLSFALEVAGGHPAGASAVPLALLLAVHRVRGLAPGLYAYDPAAHALARLRAGDLRRALVRACLGQRKAASAAVGVFMLGAIGPDGAPGGARHYRDLLLGAGAVGQRVYLAAEALGLAARNLAAFADDELVRLLGLEGRDAVPVHLTLLGAGD